MTSSASSSLRTRLLVLLSTPLTFSLLLATAGTAQAVAAPTTPTFGAAIESYPAWASEQGCLTGVRPGITAVIDRILKPTYGGSSYDFLGQRACSAGKESAHDDGKALDWMMNVRVPAEKANAQSFLAWLQATDVHGNRHAMARRLGIMYVIWNNKMLRLYSIERGWQPYTAYSGGVKKDCAVLTATSFDTICHRDHVHVSFTPDGAYQRTSFWKAPIAAPARTLKVTTSSLTTAPGSVTVRGTAVTAGDQVQLYIRKAGTTSWIAILSPVTASSTGTWAKTYTVSTTHDLQVRVGSKTSNTIRVTVK